MQLELSPTDIAKIQHRTLKVLSLAQLLAGLGLAAGVTVSALILAELSGNTAWIGLPSALLTGGSAIAGYLVGGMSQRHGRRIGLASGYFIGAIGSLGVILATANKSVPGLLFAIFIYGAGSSTNLLARYTGADLATPQNRGRAVSRVLVATTFGAVLGPNLITPLAGLATHLGLPGLTGPFMLSTLGYAAAGIILWIYLRPDPLLVAQKISLTQNENVSEITELNLAKLSCAAGILFAAQMVMVAIMSMTPVQMKMDHHSYAAVGIVIAAHVAGMFLPAPVSGWLVDKYGPYLISSLGCITIAVAAGIAAIAGHHLLGIGIGLALLGFGWSLGIVSGSTLLLSAVPTSSRARIQGNTDMLVALGAAIAGLAAGFVMTNSSFAALNWLGGAISLLLLPVIYWTQKRS